jgi:ABC-type iron transport system FetAB permease component
LYRVKRVGEGTMVLSHGGISFPVGTKLVVDDFQGLLPEAPIPLAVKVVGNDLGGISIAW